MKHLSEDEMNKFYKKNEQNWEKKNLEWEKK